MIDTILTLAGDPTAEAELRHRIADFVNSLRDSAGRGDRTLVGRAEAYVKANPATAFTFDPTGLATLTVDEHTWQAGRFETPTLAGLRYRVANLPPIDGARARLWVLDGASPVTDIGALQATAGPSALFQVASQFNCLEATGPHIARVSEYFYDPTQGPRASISAFPATLLRHYAAPGPGGERFVQATDRRQIDLLADVFAPGRSPVGNGYLSDHGGLGAEALVAALEARFDQIRVGVHDAAQVVLGYNWDGAVADSARRTISQVFTSTVAGGGYGGQRSLGSTFESACRQLQRGAYLGTLLAAVALQRRTVVLTLIGGGVFHNPIEVIWEAILTAFDEVAALGQPLDVIVNGYNLSRQMDIDTILPEVRARGGVTLEFDREGLVGVLRG